jgi:hypothetical protein
VGRVELGGGRGGTPYPPVEVEAGVFSLGYTSGRGGGTGGLAAPAPVPASRCLEAAVSTLTNSSIVSVPSFFIDRKASAARFNAVALNTLFSWVMDGSVRTCSHASRTTASTSSLAPWYQLRRDSDERVESRERCPISGRG